MTYRMFCLSHSSSNSSTSAGRLWKEPDSTVIPPFLHLTKVNHLRPNSCPQQPAKRENIPLPLFLGRILARGFGLSVTAERLPSLVAVSGRRNTRRRTPQILSKISRGTVVRGVYVVLLCFAEGPLSSFHFLL